LAASAERNNMRLVAVIISAPDSKTRFKEASLMFNYGFANYTNKTVVDCNKPLDIEVEIKGGKQKVVKTTATQPYYVFCKKGEQRSIEIDFVPIEKIKAPLRKGDLVGELRLYENGLELARINVAACEDVFEKTYFDTIKDLHKNWALY
jgi:D-alanyl-D-alanine carboxypeptidase (penicillin-binding protein 5/6)